MRCPRRRAGRNQPWSATDLAQLELLLIDGGAGTAEDVARAGHEFHGLGLFVRSQVGLDREAATHALNGFVVMDAGLLYEPALRQLCAAGAGRLVI